ncbi:MAG: efflux RND transporter permease subunit [Puniceicoccales bacterium]|jgi:HAE1 family hydrophobic/amphiphilic exporter-1|nr:efflux RND transporter permease subunit [Puniceicoccales bacterium]
MESISEPFIRRPVLTVLLTLMLSIAGIFSYRAMPVCDLPAVDYPVIQVWASFPGMDPATMAANVASPLEKEFMKIQGLESVSSSSSQGSTRLVLQFSLEKNIDGAATDVQSAISRAAGSLPSDMPAPPVFMKTDPNSQPIYFLVLASDTMTRGDLYDYAYDQVAQRIKTLKGVSDAAVYGVQRAVKILVNNEKLYGRGISIDDITRAVQMGTVSMSTGQLNGETKSFAIKPNGQLEKASDYLNLIVAYVDNTPIYLKDVADCIDKLETDDFSANFWKAGREKCYNSSVIVAVSRAAGANSIELSKGIDKLLPIFRKQIPGSIDMIKMYDKSASIIESIDDVKSTLVIAFTLVVFVIFLFLGRFTETLIPIVALPLSLLITFIVMRMLNYSIDNLSLMALTLSIGFLVDDAIVFLENMIRRMEDFGESPLKASIEGAKEISFSIVSMTLSLAAVFIPLVFMSGQVGRVFREFSITIVVAILASGIVSLTVTPMMCARMLKPVKHGNRTRLEIASHNLEHRFLKVYGKALDWCIAHRGVSVIVWVVSLIGTFATFMILPKSFLPEGDSGSMTGVFIAQEGTSPAQMREYQEKIDSILQKNQHVECSMSLSGLSGMLAGNQGLVMGILKNGKRPNVQRVSQMLARDLYAIPGILAFLRPRPSLSISTGTISTNQGKYAYVLSGVEASEIHKCAGELAAAIRQNPGFSSVSTDLFVNSPQITIDYLRAQAASYGASIYSIESILRHAFSGNYCYQVKTPTRQYSVIVESDDTFRRSAEDLNALYCKGNGGELLPFKTVAKTRETIGPTVVNHTDNLQSVSIFFNLQPKYPIGEATRFIAQKAAEIVPNHIIGSFEGEAKTFGETFSAMTLLLAIAIFVMYIILGIMYESYIHPLTVLSALPVATVGGLLTLLLFRMELTLYGFIGLFMLLGIVKKNGILMIDFAIARQKDGMSKEKAVHLACMERFRPIIMTTLAALMGQIPLAAGWGADGASRRPLGFSVIGGLVISQIVTLFILPVIYLYFEDFQEKVLDKIPFFAREVREDASDTAHSRRRKKHT